MSLIALKSAFILFFSTLLFAQDYEIKLDSLNAGGWFGGDDRPGHQRNVAIAQSVLIEKPIIIDSFSFYFTSAFDSVNGTGNRHEVILKLQVRDSSGTILQTYSITVLDTFTGGWITWPDMNYNILTSGEYIFSAYLEGGYDSIQVHSSLGCDANAGYPDGEMYVKEITNDTEAEAWGDWSRHPWDSNFWLKGSLIPTEVKENSINANQYLEQNYPNPFNPETHFEFRIADFGLVTLRVFNILGKEIETLLNEEKSPGKYKISFNAAGLPGGIYFYQLSSGKFKETKKFVLLK